MTLIMIVFLTDDVSNSSPVPTPITSCRVSTEQSPYFKAFYYHNVIKVTLDTGAEVSMIRAKLAGFFSAKMKKYQVTWLPCEVEALSIATAIKHFSPYIIQSSKQTCVLTDSKPCVQAIEKLNRGEFSSSPRVTAFLSTASRYHNNNNNV